MTRAVNQINQGPAHFFWKEPGSKYFWLCRSDSVCARQEGSHSYARNRGLCSNKTLFTKMGGGP